MAYQMDFFAADVLSKVTAAIDAKKVQYPAYVFIRSEDGSDTGRLAFVDQNNILKFVIGDEAKSQVIRVDELPALESGDTNVLYICGDIVYSFNGEEYVPTYKDHSAELEELVLKVTSLEEKSAELEKSLFAASVISTKTEYEVSSKPEGTLVDYRDKEIRIMCPADTEWVLQNSGANADANKYYIGLKAFAPEDAVSFKEDIADKIADETMYYFEDNEFAGVDEFGRKYSIVWLPVAAYDEVASTWTYYGSSSNAEKYIGWYYSVEWYNTDGIIIASDCIKVNLSNEDCHAVIEPYYVGKFSAMANEFAELQDKVNALEENVVKLEEANMTFIELE